MKKLFSYLFLAVGVALPLLFCGCTFNEKPLTLSPHTVYATPTSVHVSLIGKVTDYQTEYYLKTLLYMESNGISDLHIHLFTPGGSAVAMYSIINLIQEAKLNGVHVTTYINGACMSAGVPIFLMGDVRIMRPNSVIMLHPMQDLPDTSSISISAWEAIEKITTSYQDIIVDRTNMTYKQIKKIMSKCKGTHKNETYLLPYRALEMGFATVIK